MIRKFFVIAAIAVPASFYAQTQPVSARPAPAQSGTIVVPSTNIYVVGGGLYGGGVYVAPSGISSTESAAGISLAGQAGISINQPFDLGLQVTPTGPEYGYYGAPGSYTGTEAVAEQSGRAVNDLGPSYFGGSMPNASAVPTMSLGEIAAQYRANRPQNIRTYTNADAERLGNKIGVAGAPIAEGALSSNAPNMIAQNRPAPSPAAQPPVPKEKPEPAAKATTPETTPANPPKTKTTRLPATSTFLPLLGLVGLLSGAIGFWIRKFLR